MAVREGRVVKKESSTFGSKWDEKREGRPGLKLCLGKTLGTVSESRSEITEYQNPSIRRQKGLGGGYPRVLRSKCL